MDIQAKNDGPTSKSEGADIPQKPLNIKVVHCTSNQQCSHGNTRL